MTGSVDEARSGSARTDQTFSTADQGVLHKAQYAAALTTGSIAIVSLIGWVTGALVLASGKTAYVPMVPLTAIVLLALSGLLLFRLLVDPPKGRVAVFVVAGTVAAISLLEFVDIFAGASLGPDRLFVTASQGIGALPSVRMSPVTALAFLLLAIAFVLFERQDVRIGTSAAVLSLLVAMGGFVLLVAYSFDAPLLYGGGDLFAVALPAVVGLLLLGLGIAAFGGECWPFVLFAGDSTRAWLMRAVVPVAVLPMLGFVLIDAILFHMMGLNERPLVVSMVFILVFVSVGLVVLRAATKTGNRLDSAEEALRRSEAETRQERSRLEELLIERDRHLAQLDMSLSSIVRVVSHLTEARDPYTAGHQRRVAELAVRIAAGMRVSTEGIEEIRIASLLHDIGKISVPAEMLSKPGKLSPIEFELIKCHSQSGYEIISSAELEGPIAEIVYQHHERCDGSGYPKGLSSEHILLGAKVIMVADVVEAMISQRPYRPGLGVEAALSEIEDGAGSTYDAAVVESCLRVFREQSFEFLEV